MGLEDQYELVLLGYSTVSKFARMEDTRPEVRKALATDLKLEVLADPPAGPAARVRLASLVAAWDAARNQVQRQDELKAESKALNIRRPLGVTERVGMKKTLEVRIGSIPPHENPSPEYLAAKMEEVESGEPTASALDEVTSAEHVEEKSMEAKLDITGSIRIVSKKGKISMPKDSEEFRQRLRIEANTWMMLSTKFTNIAYLQGLEKETWGSYTDYFLGKSCAQMEVRQADGSIIPSNPIPWRAVLAYEFACRRVAFRRVREEGATLDEALRQAIRDAEIKEVNFTSPIALGMYRESGAKRPVDNAESSGSQKFVKGKGKGQKGGKGSSHKGNKGGERMQTSRRSFMSYTPDGRQICFKYNNKTGCSDGKCDRVHVCQVRGCGEPGHGATDCPKRKSN